MHPNNNNLLRSNGQPEFSLFVEDWDHRISRSSLQRITSSRNDLTENTTWGNDVEEALSLPNGATRVARGRKGGKQVIDFNDLGSLKLLTDFEASMHCNRNVRPALAHRSTSGGFVSIPPAQSAQLRMKFEASLLISQKPGSDGIDNATQPKFTTDTDDLASSHHDNDHTAIAKTIRRNGFDSQRALPPRSLSQTRLSRPQLPVVSVVVPSGMSVIELGSPVDLGNLTVSSPESKRGTERKMKHRQNKKEKTRNVKVRPSSG